MTIRINNTELDFDLFDAEFAEDYEAALNEIQGYKPPENGTLADIIRAQCNEVNRFFDRVFGEGVAADIFGESCNLNKSIDALQAVIEAANEQGAAFHNRINSVVSAAASVPKPKKPTEKKGAKALRFKTNS